MLENAEEFNIEKLKNTYPDFFKETPAKLLEFILSEKTSSKITEICQENGIKDEAKIEKIAYQITLVLLGQPPKENLAENLEKKLGIDKKIADKIVDKIKVSIFAQIISPEAEKPLLQEIETPKPYKNDAYKEPLE